MKESNWNYQRDLLMLTGIKEWVRGMRGSHTCIDEHLIAIYNILERALTVLNYEYCDKVIELNVRDFEERMDEQSLKRQ